MAKQAKSIIPAAWRQAFDRAAASATARSAARASARPTPAARGTVARAGGYAAPMDTAGVDPEMKRTVGVGGKRKGR